MRCSSWGEEILPKMDVREYAFCVFVCQGWWSIGVFGCVKLASFLEEFDAPKMKEKQIDMT